MNPSRRRLLILAPIFLAALRVSSADAAGPKDRFEACLARKHARELQASAECIYEEAAASGLWIRAAEQLESLLQAESDATWARYYLALAQWHLDSEHVVPLFRAAASAFQKTGEVTGELRARRALLAMVLEGRGDVEDAKAQAQRLNEIGRETQDSLLQAVAQTNYAVYLAYFARDFQGAYRSLKSVESVATSSGTDYHSRFGFLDAIAAAATQLGRYGEAERYLERVEGEARVEGHQEGIVHVGVEAGEIYALRMEQGRKDLREEAQLKAEETLDLARRIGDSHQLPRLHLQLARLLMRTASVASSARDHLEACLEAAERARILVDEVECRTELARLVSKDDAEEAGRLMALATGMADELRSPLLLATVARARSDISWRVDSPERARGVSLEALAHIEKIRDLQPPGKGRIGSLARWANDYRHLASHLNRHFLSTGQRSVVDEAFTVMERMRARDLRDAFRRLNAPDVSDVGAPSRHAELAQARRRLVRIQRKLLEAEAKERHALLRQLEEVEREFDKTRTQIWQTSVAEASTAPPAGLPTVQAALASNEAMLLFQLGAPRALATDPIEDGWLTVVSTSSVSHYRFVSDVDFVQRISAFQALLRNESRTQRAAARRVYIELLQESLRSLSSTTNHIIVVPDGPLHHLPFAALVALGSDSESRFAVSIAPSASDWLERRRSHALAKADFPALVFADPLSPTEDGRSSWLRGVFELGSRLSRLPGARREGEMVLRTLGEGSRLRLDAAATEGRLKHDLTSSFRVLHFATHASADLLRPDRSALFLARGPEEDGLLQSREILEIDLRGKIVFLASCRSAAGPMAPGEGVLSLARSFLAAGATAVVGSRWEIEDDLALSIATDFYEKLRSGGSVSAAMHFARRSAIRASIPTRTWSSFVVLGEGGARLLVDAQASRRLERPSDDGFGPPRRYAVCFLACVFLVALRWMWVHARQDSTPR